MKINDFPNLTFSYPICHFVDEVIGLLNFGEEDRKKVFSERRANNQNQPDSAHKEYFERENKLQDNENKTHLTNILH